MTVAAIEDFIATGSSDLAPPSVVLTSKLHLSEAKARVDGGGVGDGGGGGGGLHRCNEDGGGYSEERTSPEE